MNDKQTPSWKERVWGFCISVVLFFYEVIKSFFGFTAQDDVNQKKNKAVEMVFRRLAYLATDYWLAALSFLIVASMKSFGYSFLQAFVVLWIFDLLSAGFFVGVYEKTGKDLSLGQDFRRAIDTIHKKSRILGVVLLLLNLVKATVWTGPEEVVMFFRKEIKTREKIVVTLLVLTAAQALFWTASYGFAHKLLFY